ncbi:MAG: cytochrome c biogenesis protein [Thermoguttaceae bacterium]
MLETAHYRHLNDYLWQAAAAVMVTTAIAAIFLLAPTEETMGTAQRIVYIHVSVAWMGLAAFILMAATGGMYLFRRDLAWDHWSRAALEIGWLCCSLTLATGSLWAHAAWNTWWTWDPRLTTAFVLWAMYSAALVLRSGVEDPHRRARMGAIAAIVGVLDVPLVIMATRWFRGIHPKSPHMEPSMRVVLLISVVCFTAFFTMLLLLRRSQLHVAEMFEDLECGNLFPHSAGLCESLPDK